MLLIKEYLKLRGVSKITQFGPNAAAAVALTGRATRADHTGQRVSKCCVLLPYSNSIIAAAGGSDGLLGASSYDVLAAKVIFKMPRLRRSWICLKIIEYQAKTWY